MNLDDPVATALRVASLLERADIRYALYGGLAVAAYGVPRETKDADIAVVSADAESFLSLFEADGLQARLTFAEMRFGGLSVSRVTLLAGDLDTGLNTVDLVEPRSARYAAAAIGRAVRAPLRGHEIELLTPEDVILFKVLSTREKDLEDAAAILRGLAERLAMDLIADEIGRLTGEIQGHDIQKRWQRCVTRSSTDSP
jgi:hypothetical protein